MDVNECSGGPDSDEELDDLAASFATVEAVLSALDTDDLDTAEALVTSVQQADRG